MPKAIDWQHYIEKLNEPSITNKKEYIEYLFAKYMSYNGICEYMDISKDCLCMHIRKMKKEYGFIDANYFFCIYCGKKTYRGNGQGRKIVCDKPECVKKQERDRVVDRKIRNMRRVSIKKKKVISDNPCQRCGEDKGKNVFFCNACHHIVSHENQTEINGVSL